MRAAILFISTAISVAPAFGDPPRHEEHREERHEERRDEHREERHDERRDEHRDERREERHDDHRDLGPRERPPAMRVERHEERRGYVWVGGNWGWRGGRYEWEPGRYEHERVGMRWREPRWDVRDGVYVRVEGGWFAPGPTMAPPGMRVEHWDPRAGFLWVRGRWDWGPAGNWVWVGGHYEAERPGYIWREPRWEMRDGAYVQVGGTWEAH